jgi:LysM repeat protein
MLPAMAGRSPARFLAPLALVAFAFALFSILGGGGGGGGGEQPANTTTEPAATATATKTPAAKRKRKVYVVKPGDTPSGIAEKTGVSLEQLEEANPDLDPQLLAPGQRIRLPQ